MKKLSELLSRSIHHAGISRQVQAAVVCDTFKKIVKDINPEFGMKVRPIHFRNKVLTIEVKSSALASELQMRQREILDLINQKLGEGTIERIAWRVVG